MNVHNGGSFNIKTITDKIHAGPFICMVFALDGLALYLDGIAI